MLFMSIGGIIGFFKLFKSETRKIGYLFIFANIFFGLLILAFFNSHPNISFKVG